MMKWFDDAGLIARRELAKGRLLIAAAPGIGPRILIISLLQPLVGGIVLLQPFLLAWLVDGPLAARDMTGVFLCGAAMVGLMLLQSLGNWWLGILGAALGSRLAHGLRISSFEALRKIPGARAERIGSVALESGAVAALFSQRIWCLVIDVLVAMLMLVAMVALSPRLALGALAVIVPAGLLYVRHRRRMQPHIDAMRDHASSMTEILIGAGRAGHRDSRQASLSKTLAINDSDLEVRIHVAGHEATILSLVQAAAMLAICTTLVAAIEPVSTGAMTLGTLLAFLDCLRRYFGPLTRLRERAGLLHHSLACASRIGSLLLAGSTESPPDPVSSAAATRYGVDTLTDPRGAHDPATQSS